MLMIEQNIIYNKEIALLVLLVIISMLLQDEGLLSENK